MTVKLSDKLQSIVQRSSGSNTLNTVNDRSRFAKSVSDDLSAIIYQLNNVHLPLVNKLVDENAVDNGISGTVILTNLNADKSYENTYWNATVQRPCTIKETIDVILDRLSEQQNNNDSADNNSIDEDAIYGSIEVNELNLQQLAADTMGSYTFNDDGEATKEYPLAQAIDAIGAFFTGFPGTGNRYLGLYPTLTLTVNLSDVVIDTQLPMGVISNLSSYLNYMRIFTGMGSVGPETPNYTAYGGSLNNIIDGENLEKSIWRLDQAASTLTFQQVYDNGSFGSAGSLSLLNSKGPIILREDAVVPIGYTLKWKDASNATVGYLHDDGLSIVGDKQLLLYESTSTPTAVSGVGLAYAEADPVSGFVELKYRNDDSGGTDAQITRDGIVKELEVGHDIIRANDLALPISGAPSVGILEYSGPGVDMVYVGANFDSNTAENAYAFVSIPVDEDGNRPNRFKIIGNFILGPVGSYPGGTGIAFSIQVADNSTLHTVETQTIVNPGWSTAEVQTVTGLNSSNIDNLIVLTWSTNVLDSNASGILPIKITREVSLAEDTWDDDVSCIGLEIIWYR